MPPGKATKISHDVIHKSHLFLLYMVFFVYIIYIPYISLPNLPVNHHRPIRWVETPLRSHPSERFSIPLHSWYVGRCNVWVWGP